MQQMACRQGSQQDLMEQPVAPPCAYVPLFLLKVASQSALRLRKHKSSFIQHYCRVVLGSYGIYKQVVIARSDVCVAAEAACLPEQTALVQQVAAHAHIRQPLQCQRKILHRSVGCFVPDKAVENTSFPVVGTKAQTYFQYSVGVCHHLLDPFRRSGSAVGIAK